MEFLSTFVVPVIVGLCLVVGYLIKHVTSADNRWIPVIVAVLGVSLSLAELARHYPGGYFGRCCFRPGLHRPASGI